MPTFRLVLGAVTIAAVTAACGTSASTSVAPSSPAAAASSVPASGAPASAPAPSALASVAGVTQPAVSLNEWKVVLSGTLKSGKTDLTIKNDGTTAHEFLVFKSDLEPAAYPTDNAGDIIEEGAGVELVSDGENIDPGGTQTRSVDLAPGTYLLVCNIPGHFKQGMFSVVTVSP